MAVKLANNEVFEKDVIDFCDKQITYIENIWYRKIIPKLLPNLQKKKIVVAAPSKSKKVKAAAPLKKNKKSANAQLILKKNVPATPLKDKSSMQKNTVGAVSPLKAIVPVQKKTVVSPVVASLPSQGKAIMPLAPSQKKTAGVNIPEPLMAVVASVSLLGKTAKAVTPLQAKNTLPTTSVQGKALVATTSLQGKTVLSTSPSQKKTDKAAPLSNGKTIVPITSSHGKTEVNNPLQGKTVVVSVPSQEKNANVPLKGNTAASLKKKSVPAAALSSPKNGKKVKAKKKGVEKLTKQKKKVKSPKITVDDGIQKYCPITNALTQIDLIVPLKTHRQSNEIEIDKKFQKATQNNINPDSWEMSVNRATKCKNNSRTVPRNVKEVINIADAYETMTKMNYGKASAVKPDFPDALQDLVEQQYAELLKIITECNIKDDAAHLKFSNQLKEYIAIETELIAGVTEQLAQTSKVITRHHCALSNDIQTYLKLRKNNFEHFSTMHERYINFNNFHSKLDQVSRKQLKALQDYTASEFSSLDFTDVPDMETESISTLGDRFNLDDEDEIAYVIKLMELRNEARNCHLDDQKIELKKKMLKTEEKYLEITRYTEENLKKYDVNIHDYIKNVNKLNTNNNSKFERYVWMLTQQNREENLTLKYLIEKLEAHKKSNELNLAKSMLKFDKNNEAMRAQLEGLTSLQETNNLKLIQNIQSLNDRKRLIAERKESSRLAKMKSTITHKEETRSGENESVIKQESADIKCCNDVCLLNKAKSVDNESVINSEPCGEELHLKNEKFASTEYVSNREISNEKDTSASCEDIKDEFSSYSDSDSQKDVPLINAFNKKKIPRPRHRVPQSSVSLSKDNLTKIQYPVAAFKMFQDTEAVLKVIWDHQLFAMKAIKGTVNKAIVVCQALEDLVPEEHCKAHLIGSLTLGLANEYSDVDVYLDIGCMYEGEFDQDHASQETLTYLIGMRMDKFLSLWKDVDLVTDGKTPMVKALYVPLDLHCNVSFSNGIRVEMTRYLMMLLYRLPMLRMLVLMLKAWSFHVGLESVLKSCSVTLMVVFYLQVTGHLPSLRAVKGNEPEKIIKDWDCSFSTLPDHFQGLKQTNNIMELLHGFFIYYSETFDYESQVICPLLGKVVHKKDFRKRTAKLRDEMPKYFTNTQSANKDELFTLSDMCLQDPFELSHNLTKALKYNHVISLRAFCQIEASRCGKLLQSTEATPWENVVHQITDTWQKNVVFKSIFQKYVLDWEF